MNTRRIPFQFSTTDPIARQRELEKRFGLQPSCPKMYVDVNNPLPMGTITKETSSPRLQHRVPIFAEGYNQPIHSSSVDSMASVSDKKPNVRVIPIEFEGADSRSPRHRTHSGPADTLKDRCNNLASDRIERFPFKKYNFQDSSKPKLNAEPKVFNIPIQIESGNNVSRNLQPNFASKSPTQKPKFTEVPKPKSAAPTTNNECSQSKLPSNIKSLKKDDKEQPESNENKADQPKSIVEISLKKVEDVLTEFKTYETEVIEFTGTSRDKQYRYLDEMLTRCMLRLDDIDTMGNEGIRLARKNAVKKVQASIDLLESKANVQPVTSSGIAQIQSTPGENVLERNDGDVQMQDATVTSTENDKSSEIKEMDLSQSDKKNQNKASNTIISSSAEIESKVESAKVALERTNNISDIEMNEIEQDKESSTSSIQQPQSKMTEVFLDKVNPTCDAQSSELLRSDDSTVQNEVSSKTITNDFDMLDNLTSVDVKKSSLKETSENISDLNKSSEVSEVEMVDVQDIFSKKCEAIERSVKNNSEQNTSNEFHLDDTVSSKDSSSTLDCVNHENCDECIPDLPELDIKCDSSQSEGLNPKSK